MPFSPLVVFTCLLDLLGSRKEALQASGSARFNQLRNQIMSQSVCSRRTAQLAIRRAGEEGSIVQDNGQYRLPL